MSVRDEIMKLEEQLRQAELGPDPSFFEKHLSNEKKGGNWEIVAGSVIQPNSAIPQSHGIQYSVFRILNFNGGEG